MASRDGVRSHIAYGDGLYRSPYPPDTHLHFSTHTQPLDFLSSTGDSRRRKVSYGGRDYWQTDSSQ